MKAPARHRFFALGAHGIFSALFSASAARLARDGLGANGAAASALLDACAVAAGALAVLSARALASLARDGEARPLPVRQSISDSLQMLFAAATLAVGAQRAQMHGRAALMAFCIVSAVWLLALGFRLLPSRWLSATRLHDSLGRSLSIASLTWFRLDPLGDPRARVLLEAGDPRRVLFRTRLAGPADGVRQTLRRAGLSEGLPPRHLLIAERNGPARS